MDYSKELYRSIIAAVEAGKEILEVYDTTFEVEYKEDDSPLTLADKRSSDKIENLLSEFQIPFLSEEGIHAAYSIRKNWNKLWVVDPLDGTKEFVKRNGEFTVNIALVVNQSPVLGVIYSPVLKDIYFAAQGFGAYKIDKHQFLSIEENIHAYHLEDLKNMAQQLPVIQHRETYKVVASRSHMSSETYTHIEKLKAIYPKVDIVSTGSSIKMCWVAEGVADEYPRFGPTMEWDTAAGQAVLENAGSELIDFVSKQAMKYNREELRNNWFIAKRK